MTNYVSIQNGKQNIIHRAAAMLLYYVAQERVLTKLENLSKICYYITFHGIAFSVY